MVISESMLGLFFMTDDKLFSPFLSQSKARIGSLAQALKGSSRICQYYIVQCIEMLLSFIFNVLYFLVVCLLPRQLFALTFHDRPNHIF